MHTEDRLKQKLGEKISRMFPEHILLVTDFIDSLDQQNSDRMLTLAAAKLSEPALQKVWDKGLPNKKILNHLTQKTSQSLITLCPLCLCGSFIWIIYFLEVPNPDDAAYDQL